MSPATSHAPPIGTRRKLASPTGLCRLTLTINGTAYTLRRLASAECGGTTVYQVKRLGAEPYNVAMTDHGPTCDCPDFIFHRDGIDPGGCKHVRSLRAVGLL